jgi:DNA-binding MarR family transcriptional regulator
MDKENAKELLKIVHRIAKASGNKDTFGQIPRAEFFMMTVIDDYNRKHREEGIPGITVSRLAKIMETTIPSTSKLLRVVEGKGYIRRVLDDNDRRVVYICLTQNGTEVVRKAYAKAEDKAISILQKLGDSDTAQLIRIFNKLLTIVQDENVQSQQNNRQGGQNAE